MRILILATALLALIGVGGLAVRVAAQEKTTEQKQTVPVYRCPMHLEMQATWQAKCPKCGMNMTKAGEMSTGGMMEPAGQMHGATTRMHKMMLAQLKSGAPAALLAVRQELELRDQQVTELKAIAQDAEKKAVALLTDKQKETLKSLSEGQSP